MPEQARARARLRLSLALGAAGACLGGCYTVNDARFAAHVQSLVEVGMPFRTALDRLEEDGFECDPRGGTKVLSCSRERQSLLPTTCIERVDVVPILCAGL